VCRYAKTIAAGGLVLDLACGAGRHSRYLVDRGFSIVAADIDVARLGELARHPRVSVMEVDLETDGWPFEPERFDGIVVVNYLYRPHFPHLVESLRPGGVLIYDTFAEGNEAFGRPRKPEHLLRRHELRAAFAGLLEELAYEQVTLATPRPAIKQRFCGRRARTCTARSG
jgi:SAM-dependent methyltransferase